MVNFLIISAVCWRIAIIGKTMGETVGIDEGHGEEKGLPAD
jgi:hypothetical protein